MPIGPKPLTKLQKLAVAKRRRIRDLRAENLSWDEIAKETGFARDTCEKYYNRGVKNGEFPALEVHDARGSGTRTEFKQPEVAGAVAAGVAIDGVEDPRLTQMRESMKQCGMKPAFIGAFIKRLKQQYSPFMTEAKRYSLAELKDKLDDKISLVLGYIDDVSTSQAGLKDLGIALNILIDKKQLLDNRPTQIIDFTTRERLPVLMPMMLAEARRRGITIEGQVEVVDGPR